MSNIAVKDGDEEIVFQGRIVEVVKQPMKVGDKAIAFEYARRTPGVRLVILDEATQKILLTKEFRYEIEDIDYRLPGGKVFDSLEEYNAFLESDKDIAAPAAARAIIEAKEETGIITKSPKHFYTSVNGSTMVWDLIYFEITDWAQAEQELEDGEEIATEWVSFSEGKQYALQHMSEDRSAAVLLRWLDSHK